MSRTVIYPELDVKLTELTHESATEYMKHNGANRPWKKPLTERYLSQMLDGRWRKKLPCVVVLDKYGDVHNCQHVCRAVIAAEELRLADPKKFEHCKGPVTIAAVIITGIHPDDADLWDTGKSRSGGDVAYRMGMFNKSATEYTNTQKERMANWIATAAKIIRFRTWYREKVRCPRKFEHSEMVEAIDEHPLLKDSCEIVFQANIDSEGALASIVNPAYMVAAHYLAWHSDPNDPEGESRKSWATDFVNMLATGEIGELLAEGESPRTHPIHELREWLIVSAKGTDKGNEVLNRRYDGIVLAWNAFMNDEKVTRKLFTGKDGGDFPQMGGVDTIPEKAKESPVHLVRTALAEKKQLETEQAKAIKDKEKADAAALKQKEKDDAAAAKIKADELKADEAKAAAADKAAAAAPAGKKAAVKAPAKGAIHVKAPAKKVAVPRKAAVAAAPAPA